MIDRHHYYIRLAATQYRQDLGVDNFFDTPQTAFAQATPALLDFLSKLLTDDSALEVAALTSAW